MKLLNNGLKIPNIGFGTYKSGDIEETSKIVSYALENNYRLIDTAYFYGNEVGVGKGIKESNVKREDIFLITKLWNDNHGYHETLDAFNKSLANLQVDYIDLYLIHWPNKLNNETWKAFEKLYKEGKVKSIGVCNFKKNHLEKLIKNAEIRPMVNQVEIHPYSQKNELIEYCAENQIQLVAWSPIMRGRLFADETMISLSKKYKKSVAQVILKWHIQRNIIPIPKSSNLERIKENIDIFDFEISKEDMDLIATLDKGYNTSVTGVPNNTTYLE